MNGIDELPRGTARMESPPGPVRANKTGSRAVQLLSLIAVSGPRPRPEGQEGEGQKGKEDWARAGWVRKLG